MSWLGKLAGIAGLVAAPFTGGTSLSWVPGALGVGSAVDAAVSGRTPPFNPNAPQIGGQGNPQSQEQPWWIQNLPYMVGAGTNLLGTALQSRAQNKGNEQLLERQRMLDRLADEERKRRDYYAQALLPNLLRGTGFSKDQIAQRMRDNPLR